MKIYLASPYSHDNAAVREHRYQLACRAAADLMAQGHAVFSPIAHSHPIARFLPAHLLMDHNFWMEQDLPWLECADEVYVLDIPGTRESLGVSVEIARAEDLGKPITWIRG